MIRLFGRGLAVLLLACSFSVMAQDAITAEPDVTIREEGDRTVEEYRLNGFLYAIKVTPKSGAPYYLVAVDEDGNYVRSDQPEGLRIPSWKIFEW
ncbi:hypothetical protein LCGC14_0180050 [marine sediment metagenome]|jgi:hypothetical protein|uniref:DUF2782 domain-containing protein n=1 Tax=marine sediment metagenome TaxID=412755 RepID=A0A0F9V656_9ZZZZ|nr:DUF2782 domain-containing protein [Halopseudomonas sabulinigri]|tara:strand:+ start:828 stop:1112 length:285 start_codon:yes stop_codon:yes gene_type:complete